MASCSRGSNVPPLRVCAWATIWAGLGHHRLGQIRLGGEMVMDAGLLHLHLLGHIGIAEAVIAPRLDEVTGRIKQFLVGTHGHKSTILLVGSQPG
jgi:hypothetical protein